MPGLPVLQNAFANPGLTAAFDYGHPSHGSTYALAAAWAPGAGRFQLSAGVGSYAPPSGSSTVSYGARIAIPVLTFMANKSLGVGIFGGAGGASVSGTTLMQVPVGVSVGYRRPVGATRAISVYAAPFYDWTRASASGTSASAGLFRVSAGLDFAVTSSIGVTIGVEGGGTAKAGNPGPDGSILGVGVSYAFRHGG